MEKAIFKTLIYADIFDYPLRINEIHKWLIGRKVNIRQVEKALKGYQEYYFLPGRKKLVGLRKRKEKQSQIYFRKAKIISRILKIIPWIKLIGISGGLAVYNAGKSDDIDLFIITGKNRLWISRILALGIISLLGQRRKVGDTGREIAGKFCLNIILEEDRLEQKNKDIFVAHEVLQMKVLWQREGIYSRYLAANEWVFKFLPNWITSTGLMINDLRLIRPSFGGKIHKLLIVNHKSIFDYIEVLAKTFQLWYMKKPNGMERIEDGALYFHPNDCREQVLEKYRKKIKKIISP